jgi:LCP family protein required for cell wall assembly
MSTTQRAPAQAPRVRSAFGAAFLSLLFPGLGHAYAGAYGRALGFAAVPLLVIALGTGIVLRSDRAELIGMVASQGALIAIFVLNLVALAYRIIAAVDAWQVARFLNAADASGGGRLGRARIPVHPLSVAGLLAVILVIGAGHVVVGRYDVLALEFVNCVFSEDPDPSCEQQVAEATPGSETPEPGASEEPGASGTASPSPTVGAPTPDPSAVGTMAPSLPPWDGKDQLNILAVGVDAREGDGNSFNTDTMIVISIDPETGQVAMFQVPRDMADVPVPDNARGLWGSVYGGKINSWYNQNRNRTDLWPGKNATTRGFNSLKAILGELYGLDIRYYVKVDFQGFRDVVSTLGGVQVNVQMPVYESTYPAAGGFTRLYIPAGPQHMSGQEALKYARSRHRSTDFDRGRRQQRVLLSIKDQISAEAILANLPQLVADLKDSVKTDIPTSELPKLLALADSVDTKNIRSYVFSPSLYATEYANSPRGYIITPNVARIRKAVRQAFSVSPALMAQRERVGAEAAGVWVYNASGRTGLANRNADWLAYSGIEASAPTKRISDVAAATEVVAYNGAETAMPETVKFLEKLYGVTVTPVTDPTVTRDFIVTLGRDAPDKEVPAVG